MKITINLAIMNIDSIKLQAATLAQLTEATNELTRTASVVILDFLFSINYVFMIDTRRDEMSSTCC
jgi:hypothetical protein